MLGCFSRKLREIVKLNHFLGDDVVYISTIKRLFPLAGVIVWGRKESAKRPTAIANKLGIPLLTLEEGFVAYSVNKMTADMRKFALLSLIVDSEGIYYDANKPSYLECLLNKINLDKDMNARADHLIEQILQWHITKFNALDFELPELFKTRGRAKVLVVDQTYDDASVMYGLGNEESFKNMLLAAVNENPAAEIIVKIHPKVIDGTKKGYLSALARKFPNVSVYAGNCNPLKVIQQVDKVYTVTSQLGFEAVIAGKEVHCFGMPFYAGWGLTKDRLICPRRQRKLSVQELFFASYVQYPRYIHPVTHELCELEEILQHLILQHEMRRENAGNWYCVRLSKRKQSFIREYLQGANSIKFSRRITKHCVDDRKVLIWASRRDSIKNARQLPIHLIEDGFIRSVGLGAKLVKPNSLSFDFNGIYFDATKTNRLEDTLNHYSFSNSELELAADLIVQCRAMKITKYNLAEDNSIVLPFQQGERRAILVPGQVTTDASIKYGAIDINTNLELLKTVRKNNPDAFIIYKPHPDTVVRSRRDPIKKSSYEHYCDAYIDNISVIKCFDLVDEVHTLTSLTGFEALIRGISVYTYGLPFYAGWGLTTDRHHTVRRTQKLSIEELVAGVLIVYPRYYDYESKSFTSAKYLIKKINKLQPG